MTPIIAAFIEVLEPKRRQLYNEPTILSLPKVLFKSASQQGLRSVVTIISTLTHLQKHFIIYVENLSSSRSKDFSPISQVPAVPAFIPLVARQMHTLLYTIAKGALLFSNMYACTTSAVYWLFGLFLQR